MEINYFTLTVIIIVLIIEEIAAYYLIKYQRLSRLISSTKTSRISDLSNGFHEIKGSVIALNQPFISPYSEKACMHYNFRFEEKRNKGKTDWWEDLIKDEKMQRFGVDEGSGIAVVDFKSAKIELKKEEEGNNESLNMSYSNQERVLKRYGVISYDGK